jgi:hypothetical protein
MGSVISFLHEIAVNVVLPDGLIFQLIDPVGRTIGSEHYQRNVAVKSFGHGRCIIECGCTGTANQRHRFLNGFRQSDSKISGTAFVNYTAAIKFGLVASVCTSGPLRDPGEITMSVIPFANKIAAKLLNMFFC